MPNVIRAMENRLRLLGHCYNNPFRIAQFCTAFASALNHQYQNTMAGLCRDPSWVPKVDGRYFRWFDSGDLQGAWHLNMIFGICQRTPDVAHKLPTKETVAVEKVLRERTIPENLQIKLSAPLIDMPPMPQQEDLVDEYPLNISIAQVYETRPPLYHPCPVAVGTTKTCAECRWCWDNKSVSFRRHR
jgi:hypothetical protein